VAELLGTLRALVPPITTFFDKVLVMSEDPAQRRNRLALVQQVVSLAENVADLSRLEGF
jgi:glycyl-tRNA synthetase beta chain